jgi:8-oxo-dGTP diphosphatase
MPAFLKEKTRLDKRTLISLKKSVRKEKTDDESTIYCYEFPRPAVAVDVVVFRLVKSSLEVLLIKRARAPFKGRWAFPGGFVDVDEPLEKAAARELQEETGLRVKGLRQFRAYGDPGRDPRGHTISVVFIGMVGSKARIEANDDAADARWHSVRKSPKLAFDHGKILHQALSHRFPNL